MISVLASAVALFVGGAIVGRVTSRPLVRSGLRQLALGAAVDVVNYGICNGVGHQSVSPWPEL